MHDSVAQAQRLIGARLRDSRRHRQGRIVGVDQAREHPALLIVWEGQVSAERVSLPAHELQALVASCDAAQPAAKAEAAADSNETGATADPERDRITHVGGR